MFCTECGNKFEDESAYCGICGEKRELGEGIESNQQNEPEERVEPAKKSKSNVKKKKMIIGGLSAATAIIIISVALVFILAYNPVESAFEAIEEKNYARASNIYEKRIAGKSKREAEFTKRLDLELENVFNEFEEQDASYDEVVTKLDRLNKLGSQSMSIENMLEKVTNINDSRIAFKQGNGFAKKENYIEAINSYNKVIKEDIKNYTTAQQKSEELLVDYREQVLADIRTYAQDEDYESVLLLLEEVRVILPNDQDMNDSKTLYTRLFEEQKAQQPVTIRTVSQFGGTDPTAEAYEYKLQEFRSEYPWITVYDESDTADEAWKASIATDFALGNEPDVIFTFTGLEAKAMIEQGKVVSLDEIRREFPDYASHISEGVLKSVQEFDGNTYAVPVRGFYEGIFVNKRLFQDYGLELPTDWNKFEKAVATFNSNGVVPVAVALGHLPHYWIEHLILSQGGVDVHRNQNIAEVKDDWVKGLGYFKRLYDMGAFPRDTNSTNNDITTELFNAGEAAMMLDGNWAIGGFGNPDDYSVIPLPVVPGGAAHPTDIISGFSTGWYITTKAWEDPVKRVAAVQYVEKMIEVDTIAKFVGYGGTPSAAVGEIYGLPRPANDGFKMQVTAQNLDMPMDSWLSKPAWDKLISLIPGIATGVEDPAAVVDEVIRLSR